MGDLSMVRYVHTNEPTRAYALRLGELDKLKIEHARAEPRAYR
ncbi:MAG: hypothetical protein ACLUSP_08965 [Christensenellales bacterium]